MHDLTIDISHAKGCHGAWAPHIFLDGFFLEGITAINPDLKNEEMVIRIRPKSMHFKNFDGDLHIVTWDDMRKDLKDSGLTESD